MDTAPSASAMLATPARRPTAYGLAQPGYSRSALALAIAGHVLGALLFIKLLDVRRAVVVPPLIVEILQPEPEVRKEPPPPKKKPPEPKVEEPPPPAPKPPEPRIEPLPLPRPEPVAVKPEVLPEPLPQVEMPMPQVEMPLPPVTQPIQQARREPVPEQVHPRPEPVPAPIPTVRRPVEPVQVPPPPLTLPKDPVRELPTPPILAAKAPTPLQTVVEPPRVVERPIQAPDAPRVAPREPPRRAVPEAPPVMEIAAAPLPEGAESDAAEPPPVALPQPTGPAPEGPEIGLNAQMLTALYLRNPKPGYPAASRRLREQGTVMLRAFITTAGEATRVELKSTSGYPRLDRAALESVRYWKFVPAKRDDKPVDAWVLVPIKFSLNK